MSGICGIHRDHKVGCKMCEAITPSASGINQVIEKLEKIQERVTENDIRNAGSQDVAGSIIATEITEALTILKSIKSYLSGPTVNDQSCCCHLCADEITKRILGE